MGVPQNQDIAVYEEHSKQWHSNKLKSILDSIFPSDEVSLQVKESQSILKT
jgi:hypothetical protein